MDDNFKGRVLRVVRGITRGSTMSYGQVAAAAGTPGAARAVGAIMAGNTDKGVPCHRVIRSDGSIGKYNGLRGESSKRELLITEGAIVAQ